MDVKQISISADFKNKLTKAIFSIVLFMVVYLILFLTGSLIALFAITLGGIIILDNLGLFGILLGLGAIGMGVMVFIFLIKFIFKRNIVDRSHLIEIKATDEPRLFALLQEIVDETHTLFPKKVYLSSNVNAGVFYNSSFWSMFFPVRKNLEIGLGLVNGISKAELKAILAHEFGHFSQGSMKVGSYVYQVNQVLYNLLFENTTFNLWLQRWSSISGYFWIFVWLGLQFIRFTQWILGKIYNLVNVSYMGLSRAMEFHADEVAARVTGSEPMITGLSRIDFINVVFNDVLDQYTRKIPNSIKTQNVYPPHRFVMQFLAKRYEYPILNGLPQIDLGNNRYNKSKLVIDDQWASHPSTPDRVKALQVLNIPASVLEEQPADQLFEQLPKWQTQLTQLLFKSIEYQTLPKDEDLSSFQEDYSANYEKYNFPSFYNGYYDQHNPISHKLDELLASVEHTELAPSGSALFDPSAIDLMYGFHGLENDLGWLESIQKGTYMIKTVDYAGKKYRLKEIPKLIPQLQQELEATKAKIKIHDLAIFRYFYALAQKASRTEDLIQYYKTFLDFNHAYPEKLQLAQEIRHLLTFIEEKLPYKTIESNLAVLQGWEEKLKVAIRQLLEEPIYQAAIIPEMRKHFNVYCGKQWQYFAQTAYYDDALNVLFSSIGGYETVLQDTYFNLKKDLLNFQVELEKTRTNNSV